MFKKYTLSLGTAILAVLFTATAQVKKPLTHISSPNNGTVQVLAGKAVYMKYCVSCHQLDGGGVQKMNPPLIKTSYVLGDKAKIIQIVLNGLKGVDIDDETYNNAMPSMDQLRDNDIADVLTYVRNSFGNKASAVKTAEVTKLRGVKK